MKDRTLDDRATEAVKQFVDAARRPSSRRDALRTLGKLGLGAAALSLATFGSRPRRALAQSSEQTTPVEILNYLLTLEYLEQYYYQIGTDSGVVPSDRMDVFELLQRHEEAHVRTLTQMIEALEADAAVAFDAADFDFTAGGAFDPFNDYATFLLLAQAFEDVGVRAYKGQLPLLGRDTSVTVEETEVNLLTAVFQIHSLEARHAAEVRRLRSTDSEGAGLAPWIVGDDGTDGSAIEAVYGAGTPPDRYPAEENSTQPSRSQAPFNVVLTELGEYTDAAASAAFDEPLGRATVLDIVASFRLEGTEDPAP